MEQIAEKCLSPTTIKKAKPQQAGKIKDE